MSRPKKKTQDKKYFIGVTLDYDVMQKINLLGSENKSAFVNWVFRQLPKEFFKSYGQGKS